MNVLLYHKCMSPGTLDFLELKSTPQKQHNLQFCAWASPMHLLFCFCQKNDESSPRVRFCRCPDFRSGPPFWSRQDPDQPPPPPAKKFQILQNRIFGSKQATPQGPLCLPICSHGGAVPESVRVVQSELPHVPVWARPHEHRVSAGRQNPVHPHPEGNWLKGQTSTHRFPPQSQTVGNTQYAWAQSAFPMFGPRILPFWCSPDTGKRVGTQKTQFKKIVQGRERGLQVGWQRGDQPKSSWSDCLKLLSRAGALFFVTPGLPVA